MRRYNYFESAFNIYSHINIIQWKEGLYGQTKENSLLQKAKDKAERHIYSEIEADHYSAFALCSTAIYKADGPCNRD